MFTTLPATLFKVVFLIWISISFKNTFQMLDKEQDKFNYNIIFKTSFAFFTMLLLGGIVEAIDMFSRINGNKSFDRMWKMNWILESGSFFFFTIFIICIMYIYRPTTDLHIMVEIENITEEEDENEDEDEDEYDEE